MVVGEQEVSIAMIECSAKREPTTAEAKAMEESPLAPRSCFITTGRMRVGIGWMRFESRHVVEETPDDPLENRISEVIGGLLRQAEQQHQSKLHGAEQKRLREEQEKIRLQSQREQQEELQRRRSLEQFADRWHTSERLRTFVKRCEQALGATSAQNPAVVRWLAWALEHADRVDPLKDGSIQNAINFMPPGSGT